MDSSPRPERPLVVINHAELDDELPQAQTGHDHEGQRTPSNVSVVEDSAFADFDGVHLRTDSPVPASSRSPSLVPASSRSPSPVPSFSGMLDMAAKADDIELEQEPEGETVPYIAPQDSEEAWYPAPIPAEIVLPPKLSKRPTPAQFAKRRTQLLETQEDDSSSDGNKRKSAIPPQLRASLFFDTPVDIPDVVVQTGTPTETLERLLQISVNTPTDSFTDHPWVGGAGGVYDREPGLARITASGSVESFQRPLYKRASASMLNFAGIRSNPTTVHNQADSVSGDESDPEADQDEFVAAGETENVVEGRPNTLVAELQLRKQQQRARNRPGLEAVLDGARSTLLEMDAVAQIEKQRRQQNKTKLAWEHTRDEEGDEDVPLGMLYKDQRKSQRVIFSSQPLIPPGLLEQRELEENEPLSARRRRLQDFHRNNRSQFSLEVPGVTELPVSGDEEDETLGQRMRRLKGKGKHQRRISAEFSKEMLNHLGVPEGTEQMDNDRAENAPGPLQGELPPNATETLQPTQEKAPFKRISMGDLLLTNPVGQSRSVTPPASRTLAMHAVRPASNAYPQPYSNPTQPRWPPRDMPSGKPVGQFPQQFVPANQMMSHANQQQHTMWPPSIPMASPTWNLTNNGQSIPYYHPTTQTQNADPQQRSAIDQWRQSVS